MWKSFWLAIGICGDCSMVVNKAKERMRLDVEALYKRSDENHPLFSIELRNNFDRGKLFIERETLVTDQKNQLKYST